MDYPIAIIFDVEGTLIDCASQTLECWRQVLGEFEHSFRRDELQPYSGMDSSEMLQCLLPKEPRERRQEMLKRHGDLYRERYLHSVRPFPAVFDTFKALAKRSVKVGIATTCTREELAIYDKQMRVLKFAAAIACGDDVQHGKPHPDLFRVVLRRLGVADRLRVLSVGDTPYDAKPAIELGLHAIGVLTGGFSREELQKAGCGCVLERACDTPLEAIADSSATVSFPKRAKAGVDYLSQANLARWDA